MKSLFEIGNEYLEIYHLLEDNGGEITPEIETALAINKSNLQEKSQNYISLIKEIEGRSRTVEIEIKRLQALKKRNDTFVLKLKENIANAMRMLEIDEIRTDLNKINFRKSKSVQIEDIEMLPNAYVIIEKKPISKTELKRRIENGEVINGVSIIENLNLQIK